MPKEPPRRQTSRRQLALELQERQRRDEVRRRRVLFASIASALVLVVAVVLVVALTKSDSNPPPAAGSPSSNSSTRSASDPCTWTSSGTAARPVTVPSTTTPPKTGSVTVNVTTSRGPMIFTLDRREAPCTVASFVSLVQQHFYDRTPCPRLEDQSLFILQCGDPTGTGTGGPGYTIPDEYTGSEKYTAGVLAMANSGTPHSGGSQFFIVYKADALPPKYTIFGSVTRGLDVVTKVAAGGDDGSSPAGGGKPKLAIDFTKLTVG